MPLTARRLASILLDRKARFSKTRRRYADLNQAEGFSPLGSSPFPDPRNVGVKSSGDEGRTMNLLIRLKRITLVFFAALALICLGLGLPTTALGGTNVIIALPGTKMANMPNRPGD